MFVHFKKDVDVRIPVRCRTENDEGNQKENTFVRARKIVNDSLNAIKMKRKQTVGGKKRKKILEFSKEGSKRKKHKGNETDKGEREKKNEGNSSTNDEDLNKQMKKDKQKARNKKKSDKKRRR